MLQRKFTVLILFALGAPLPICGQTHVDDPAAISASATGSVELKADHAIVKMGVLFQDSTAMLAAAGMDGLLRSVTDTLMRMSFPADSIPTARYSISPVRDRERSRIVGYTANAAVRLTIWDLSRLPAVIGAALAAGATDITGLQFGASEERDARDEALRRALSAAFRDAEVLAEAAGGRLGTPIEITTTEARRPMGRSAAAYLETARSVGLSAEITPDAIVIEATVHGRWRFESN